MADEKAMPLGNSVISGAPILYPTQHGTGAAGAITSPSDKAGRSAYQPFVQEAAKE